MSEDKGTLEAPPSTITPKLRSYSRRALKRRTTSPETVSAKTSQSMPSSAPEFLAYTINRTDEATTNRSVSNNMQRRLNKATSDITPTDMFFTHINSSTPSLDMWANLETQNQRNVPDTCQVQTAAVANTNVKIGRNSGFEKKNEEKANGTSVPRAASDIIETPIESVEDIDDDELSREVEKWLDDLSPTSCNTRVKRFALLSSKSPSKEKAHKNKSFITKKAAWPAAFMKDPQLLTSQVSIPSVRNTFKITKRMSDGFTKAEARPTPHSARRRKLKELQSELEPLELTQKLPITQKVEGPVWLRGQKKTRPVEGTKSESIRRFASGSQRQLEVQDPLDDFDNPISSSPGGHSVAKRSIDDINSDDLKYPVDLRVDPEDESSLESLSSSVLTEQELDINLDDADEEVDLLSIPRTDMLESAFNVACGLTWNRDSISRSLPPKKLPNKLDCDNTGLRLRPNSRIR